MMNMNLTDRDALKRQYETVCIGDCEMCSHSKWDLGNHICTIIEAAPTVDAVPVVHGEWEEIPYRRADANHCGSPTARFRCTHCKHRTGYVNAMKWDYCPYCGAKMDATDNNVGDK